MLVNVEQGAVNPSVGTLLRLSDALGVGLPALVEPPRPRPLKVVRRGEGAALWSSEAAAGASSSRARSRRTSPSCGTGRSHPATTT